jgi:hypothetical protein
LICFCDGVFLLTVPIDSTGLEGHHLRLQHHIMPELSPTATDLFVNKLWAKENNYRGVMNDLDLWSDKKKRYMQDLNHHLNKKRIDLKDMTGSRTVTHYSFVKTTTTATAMTSIVDSEDEDFSDLVSPFDHVAPVSSPLQTTASLPKTTLPTPPIPPSTTSPSIPPSTLHPFFQQGDHKPSTTTADTPLPPCLDIAAHVRCKCGQYKFN